MKYKIFMRTNRIQSRHLLISVCLFWLFCGNAQNDIHNYMEVDTILSFPNEICKQGSFLGTTWKNYFVFTNHHTTNKNDSLFIYRIDLDCFKMDTFVWYQQGINNYLIQNLNTSFSAILYNKKYIVFVGYKKLFVLKNRGDDFSFEFYREITLKNNYSHIWQFVGETKILLGDMYYSHKPPTLLTIYDIEKESVEKEIQPYYNHVLWQYFSPLHPVDNRNGQILFSHRAEYAIVVYDTLLQKKDSIYRNIEDWNSLSPKTISYIKKKYKKNEAASIMGYLSRFFLKRDHLLGVYYLNDNQMMTIYYPHPNSGEKYSRYHLDIWNKKEDTWHLVQKDIVDKLFGDFTYENDTLTKQSFPLGLLSGNNLFVTENYFIVFQGNNGVDFNPIGLTKTAYQKKYDEYFMKNAACVQLYFYKYKF